MPPPRLQQGNVRTRRLLDGDILLQNRAPTLGRAEKIAAFHEADIRRLTVDAQALWQFFDECPAEKTDLHSPG